MKNSLAKKFILVVLITLAAGQAVIWLWLLSAEKKEEGRMLDSKAAAIFSLLQKSSVTGMVAYEMAAYDFSNLEGHIEALSGDEDMISLRLEDRRGTVLKEKQFRPEPEKAKKGSFLYLPGIIGRTGKVVNGGEELGRLEIKLGGERANSALKRSLLAAIFGQVLVFAALAVVVSFFFRKELAAPMKQIRGGLDTLAKGDFAEDIKIDGSSELAGIGASLNSLKESYGKSVGRLRATAENVEMAIMQMNMTFNNLGAGIKRQGESINEIISALKGAAGSQQEMVEGTEKLSEFSTENVTSLLEVKATAEEIATSTGRLFQAVEGSYSALSQFSESAKEIAANAQDGSKAVEETSASAEEINASVKEIEKSVKESATLAEKVRTIAAEEGVLSITEAIEEMEKVTGQVRSSVEIVGRLGTRSKDIEKMLLVIKDVTEQTNLLSLNAAILAAQAGEYGKGFSVVANEMHALSERTTVSTKEIAAVVKTIQGEIAGALASIEATMKFVERGTEQVYKAGTITASVLEAAQGSSQMARSIHKSTEEQARGLAQIALALEHLREMIFRVAQATEEQSRGSGYMLAKMAELKEIAELTSKGTREQAEGTRHITENIELAGERIMGIKDFIKGQEKTQAGILSSIESIKNTGLAAARQIEEMTLSLETLQGEANALKEDSEALSD